MDTANGASESENRVRTVSSRQQRVNPPTLTEAEIKGERSGAGSDNGRDKAAQVMSTLVDRPRRNGTVFITTIDTQQVTCDSRCLQLWCG